MLLGDIGLENNCRVNQCLLMCNIDDGCLHILFIFWSDGTYI